MAVLPRFDSSVTICFARRSVANMSRNVFHSVGVRKVFPIPSGVGEYLLENFSECERLYL